PMVERKPGFIPGATMQLLLHLAFSSPAFGGFRGGILIPPRLSHGGAEARIHSGRHHAAATAPSVLVASVWGVPRGDPDPPAPVPWWSGSPDSFRAPPCSCYCT